MRNLLKVALLAVVVYFAYTRVVPLLREPIRSSPAPDGTMSTGDTPCPDLAALASETWRSGLSHFINPPYRLSDWGLFHSDVQLKLADAKDGCRCTLPSCAKTREALLDLTTLVSSADSAVRAGQPMPSDAPKQQERVNQGIKAAKELARNGK